MAICSGCGGVIGRDCFNPMECQEITRQMANDASNMYPTIEFQNQHIQVLQAENARLKYALDELQAFKNYVHKRLDDAGIPTHPDGEHSKAGCRIGDRLDIVLKGSDKAENARLRAALEEIKNQMLWNEHDYNSSKIAEKALKGGDNAGA